MLKLAMLIAQKDLILLLGRRASLAQAFLLGLLILFMFSLAQTPGQPIAPQAGAAIFWLSSIFYQILIFNQLYDIEERNSSRHALLLLPLPIQGIWLGKGLVAFALLTGAQLFFLPAAIVFLGQNLQHSYLSGLAILFLTDIGICSLGSLLGAASSGQSGADSLLSIILFPLLIPLLMAAIGVGSAVFGAENINVSSWLGMACAFDAIFFGAGLLLFGFIYGREE